MSDARDPYYREDEVVAAAMARLTAALRPLLLDLAKGKRRPSPTLPPAA